MAQKLPGVDVFREFLLTDNGRRDYLYIDLNK